MKIEQRYCILCAGPIAAPLGLRERTITCPNCGGEIKIRRTITGREIYRGQAPDDNVIIEARIEDAHQRGGEEANEYSS